MQQEEGPAPDQSLRPSIWPGQVSRASFDCVCVLLKRRSRLMTHLIHGVGTDGETCAWSNGRILGTIMHDSFWWKLIFVANQGIWLIFYSADAKFCSRVKLWNIHWFRTTRASQYRTDAMLVIMMMTLTKMMVWNDDDDGRCVYLVAGERAPCSSSAPGAPHNSQSKKKLSAELFVCKARQLLSTSEGGTKAYRTQQILSTR